MTDIKEFFESAYRGDSEYWWNVPYAYSTSPDDLAPSLLGQATLRFATSRPPGRAIDIGSGEGADAIRLARLGWDVQAVELTSAGCAKIRTLFEFFGVNITIHQADIRDFNTNDKFDLLVCNGVLHYLPDKRMICRKFQSMTAPAGANVILLWSDHTPIPDCHKILSVYPDSERGVVYDTYKIWQKELLYFERAKPDVSHDDMPPHVHSHIKMVAIRKDNII